MKLNLKILGILIPLTLFVLGGLIFLVATPTQNSTLYVNLTSSSNTIPYTENAFNNSLTAENITYSGTQSFLRYIEIPKNSNVTGASLAVRGYTSTGNYTNISNVASNKIISGWEDYGGYPSQSIICTTSDGVTHVIYYNSGVYYTNSTSGYNTSVLIANNTGDASTIAMSCYGSSITIIYNNDTNSNTHSEDLFYNRSTDSGISWTSGLALNGSDFKGVDEDITHPLQIYDNGSEIFVIYSSTNRIYENPSYVYEDPIISMITSTDGGSTWSSPTQIIDTNLKNGTTCTGAWAYTSSLYQDVGGTHIYAAGLTCDNDTGDEILIRRSDDGGNTWTAISHTGLNNDPAGIVGNNSFAWLAIDSSTAPLYYSSDNGNTWNTGTDYKNYILSNGAPNWKDSRRLGLKEDGTPYIVFTENDSVYYNIYINEWKDGDMVGPQLIFYNVTTYGAGPKMESELIENNNSIHVVYTPVYNGYANVMIVGNLVNATNPKIDALNSGLNPEWAYSGELTTTQEADLNASGINDWLSSCTADSNGICSLPLNITSTGGKLQLSNINVSYNYNTSYLFTTSLSWNKTSDLSPGKIVNKTKNINNTSSLASVGVSVGGYYVSGDYCEVNGVSYSVTGTPKYCAYTQTINKGTNWDNLKFYESGFGSGTPVVRSNGTATTTNYVWSQNATINFYLPDKSLAPANTFTNTSTGVICVNSSVKRDEKLYVWDGGKVDITPSSTGVWELKTVNTHNYWVYEGDLCYNDGVNDFEVKVEHNF